MPLLNNNYVPDEINILSYVALLFYQTIIDNVLVACTSQRIALTHYTMQ